MRCKPVLGAKNYRFRSQEKFENHYLSLDMVISQVQLTNVLTENSSPRRIKEKESARITLISNRSSTPDGNQALFANELFQAKLLLPSISKDGVDFVYAQTTDAFIRLPKIGTAEGSIIQRRNPLQDQ
ncbi:hypothetical protein T4B_7679 [Trichinella pseudospiralis]|uniref:Uncharacterized protein n=1 Tax=Trichinella pseudospiralis TaxID=6337 RepID=A0A0V1EX64_TRIPS|nr:hypothetical protein T4A_14024 [Trichinella pseudospiralis]KRZ31729.1 hypothetical protein T4B_7679 [Trichinella pseudospiralis]KRZ44991.1 hypothetical protein T4C_4319 [Trichinella pseudospiralis]